MTAAHAREIIAILSEPEIAPKQKTALGPMLESMFENMSDGRGLDILPEAGFKANNFRWFGDSDFGTAITDILTSWCLTRAESGDESRS